MNEVSGNARSDFQVSDQAELFSALDSFNTAPETTSVSITLNGDIPITTPWDSVTTPTDVGYEIIINGRNHSIGTAEYPLNAALVKTIQMSTFKTRFSILSKRHSELTAPRFAKRRATSICETATHMGA